MLGVALILRFLMLAIGLLSPATAPLPSPGFRPTPRSWI